MEGGGGGFGLGWVSFFFCGWCCNMIFLRNSWAPPKIWMNGERYKKTRESKYTPQSMEEENIILKQTITFFGVRIVRSSGVVGGREGGVDFFSLGYLFLCWC